MGVKRESSKNLGRILVFVLERFGAHELANHAAAGAYAFLLSATPALLIVLGLSRAALARFPRALENVAAFFRELLGPLGAGSAAEAFFARPLGFAATVLAILSLIWAARLFVVAVQRGLRVVWGASAQLRPVRENLLTFGIELLLIVTATLILGLSKTAELLVQGSHRVIAPGIRSALVAGFRLAPAGLLFLFAYGSILLIPPARPRRKHALIAAGLCLALYATFSALLSSSLDRARYDLLYGVFGSLIVLLLNVYVFFTIFYYCAELAFVLERFDSLLLSRFLRVSRAEAAGRIDRSLFGRPDRLISSYGREYAAGETIFAFGDASREAYYLVSGKVGVFIEGGKAVSPIASIEPGEFFGEMAGLLEEPRTATTRALEDSLAVVLPQRVFEELLSSDLEAARRMIALLSERLKRSNLRSAQDEAVPGDAPRPAPPCPQSSED